MSHPIIDAREVPVITTLGTVTRYQLRASAVPPARPWRPVAVVVGSLVAGGAVLAAVGYALGSAAGQ